MALLSVTRLHLRSMRYFPLFVVYTWRSGRQVRRSTGFRRGVLGGDPQRGSWTVTLWDSEADMRAYRNAGAHRDAMVRLLTWCDEASFVHWTTDASELPSMDEAYERLSTTGKVSKVHHPSKAHVAGRTVSDGRPRIAVHLKGRASR